MNATLPGQRAGRGGVARGAHSGGLGPGRIAATGPPGAAGRGAVDDERDRAARARFDAGGHGRERLPVLRRADALQQYAHGAFAAAADAEQPVVLAAHVVFRAARSAGFDDGAGVLDEIGLEAAAGQQPERFVARRDQHLRAGLAVGRALGREQGREHERFAARGKRAEVAHERREGRFEGVGHG